MARFGLHRQLKGAIDEQERQALIRCAAVNTIASMWFVAAIVLITHVDDGWVLTALAGSGFISVIMYQSIVAQPRILQWRHAMEAARNPVLAAKMRRREHIQCWLGVSIGLICGIGGLIAGLVASGRV